MQSIYLFVVVALGCLACYSYAQSASTVAGWHTTKQTGDGTYYGNYGGGGACTIDQSGLPSPFTTGTLPYISVALNAPQYGNSITCGMCVQVTPVGTGTGTQPIQPFIGYVNNLCPECASGSLDLGMTGDGRWQISWVMIDCPVGSSLLQYEFEGTNAYYLKIQARNSRIPISQISVQNLAGTFVDLAIDGQNFHWLAPSGVSNFFPMNTNIVVKVTAISGATITDTIPWLASGTTPSKSQFPATYPAAASSTSGTTKSATTTTTTTSTTKAGTTSSTATTKAATTTTTATTKSATTTTTATTKAATTTTTTTATTKSATTSATATTKAATTTTTGSSTTGSSTSPNIFADAYVGSWSSYSYPSGQYGTSTSIKYAGTTSLYLNLINYSALYFHSSTTFAASSKSTFSFYVYGGSSGSQPLQVIVYDGSGTVVGTTYSVPAITQSAWKQVSISTGSFKFSSTSQVIGGIAIQAATSSTAGTVYVDNVNWV